MNIFGKFQLTRLMRGVTKSIRSSLLNHTISTHTPHARRDNIRIHAAVVPDKFQLTRLMRGVTKFKTTSACGSKFQLTRLMRGVTKGIALKENKNIISTHTPHARRDLVCQLACSAHGIFQLTRLMRGVTSESSGTSPVSANFNSHASCEA